MDMLNTVTSAVSASDAIKEEQYYTVREIAVLLHYSERWVRKELKGNGFKKTGAKYLVLGRMIKTLVTDNMGLLEVGGVN